MFASDDSGRKITKKRLSSKGSMLLIRAYGRKFVQYSWNKYVK